MSTSVSIIIVHHNTKELLRQCLASLMETTHSVDKQLIVVDNASSDGSSQMLGESFPEVTLLKNKSNIGFSQANNQGVKKAIGPYLLFLNPDTIVCDGAIEGMVRFLESRADVGAVGCKLLNADGSLQRSCGLFPSLRIELFTRTFLNRMFPRNRTFNMHNLASWDYSAVSEVDWATGACLMVRKDVFHSLSGFDENIFMFYEDVDLCLRIWREGWKVLFYPDSVVFHLRGGSWKQNREVPIQSSYVNALYFYRKHYSKAKLLVLKVLLIVEVAIGIAAFVPYLILKKENSSAILSRLRGYLVGLEHVLFH